MRSPYKNIARVSCDTCFNGSFVTSNSIVTFIFTFDLRSGQFQVKKGQILTKQNLKKHAYFSVFFSQDSKNVVLFCCTTIGNSKNRVSKNDVITINRFLGHFTAKNKDIGWKFCTTVGNT